ncbi:hypothetical protein [Sphingomonas sp. YL-JM2C]
MAQRIVQTLTDLCNRHGGGWMLVRCSNPLCKRMRIFEVREIRDYWRNRGWSDVWRDIPRHFYCVLCGSRPERPDWIERRVDIPVLGAPEACLAPYGIDSRAWALAGPEDRERLIKARR